MKMLAASPLFKGIPSDVYDEVLEFLGAQICSYEDHEQLVRMGDELTKLGIVVSGKVRVGFVDELGSERSVSYVGPGDMFGEATAGVGVPSIVQVDVETPCEVLWLEACKVMSVCDGYPWRARITENFLRLLAEKNVFLNRKMQIISQKRLRDRIKMYLQDRRDSDGTVFEIPFSHTEWARYLFVDRSALSREIGHLRDEGIFRMEGNRIVILDKDFLS